MDSKKALASYELAQLFIGITGHILQVRSEVGWSIWECGVRVSKLRFWETCWYYKKTFMQMLLMIILVLQPAEMHSFLPSFHHLFAP